MQRNKAFSLSNMIAAIAVFGLTSALFVMHLNLHHFPAVGDVGVSKTAKYRDNTGEHLGANQSTVVVVGMTNQYVEFYNVETHVYEVWQEPVFLYAYKPAEKTARFGVPIK